MITSKCYEYNASIDMGKGYPYNVKKGSALAKIGFWATAWWAISGLYLVILVFIARGFGFSDAFADHGWLWWLLAAVVLGWVVGAQFWLRELKKAKVPYRSALKDLFLTIRK